MKSNVMEAPAAIQPGIKTEAAGDPPPPASFLLQALDAKHDGVIDADEIAKASSSLKTLDKNSDGKLTPDELRPPCPEKSSGPVAAHDPCPPPQERPEGVPGKGQLPPPKDPLMRSLDTKHDGVIDADEIAKASSSLKILDKNGDGKLTPDELHPPCPEKSSGPVAAHDPCPPPQERPEGVPGKIGHRPPPPHPLMQALDTNHDG